MVDIDTFSYMGFVRFDLKNKEFDQKFNQHFNDHIQELSNKPGYSTAWRTRELRGADNAGVMEQEYQQIYAIKDPGLFKSFPQNPPPPVLESEPWRRDIDNWGRVFYKVLSLTQHDDRNGRCWARIEMDFQEEGKALSDIQNEVLDYVKILVRTLPGVHRVWQLQHVSHSAQIGSDPMGSHMLLYELDAPENLFDPSLGEERIPHPQRHSIIGRHFSRLLAKTHPIR